MTEPPSLVQRVPNLENMKHWNSWVEKEVFETLVELRASMKDPLESVWWPSHCGVVGNETAVKAAADGCYLSQAEVAVLLDSAKNVIKRKLKVRSLPTHETAAVYIDNEGAKKYHGEKNLTRQKQTTISRLKMAITQS